MSLVPPTRCFVIGCGSIGQRHIRNLRSMGFLDIFAYDPVVSRLEETTRSLGVNACDSVESGLDRKPSAVLVCTPPNLHVSIARQALTCGSHVFVEKPLGDSLDQIDALINESACRERILYVGYNLRFHAGLLRLKQLIEENTIGRVFSIHAEFGQYLPDWRPGRDYRACYTARGDMGGGVILDGSHELDYVRWLGEEVEAVCCVAGRLGALEMDAEDTAEITLRMKKGLLAHVHLDCIQRGYSRGCKVIGDTGTLVWDFKPGIRFFNAEAGQWQAEAISPDVNDMYVEELKHFMLCTEGVARPTVDGKTGKRVLEIALAAKRSSREGREVVV